MTAHRMDHHQWDTALDPELTPLFLELQWAHARSIETMRPRLLKHGLSMAEFDVLATLRNAEPPHEMTPSRIQHEMVITSGGLTKLMLQLEARGLLKRLQSRDDLRVKPVQLTALGQQLIEATMSEMIGCMGQWIRQTLNPDEISQLTRLLGKIVDSSLEQPSRR